MAAAKLPQVHWRTACEALFEEEYDWVLLFHDFRGEDFVVSGLGAADSGWVRLIKALPSDQVVICFVRPRDIRSQPFLLIYSPPEAPFRHVTVLDTVKEKFWIPFLSSGVRCPSKTVVAHSIREACDAIDSELWDLIQEPAPVKPPEPNIDDLLAGLDAVTKQTGAVVLPEPKPAVVAQPEMPAPPAQPEPQPVQPAVDNRPTLAPAPDRKKGCCQLL